MALQALTNIRTALHTLNPDGIRELGRKPVHISLHAGSDEGYRRMESFLLQELRPSRRLESLSLVSRGPSATAPPGAAPGAKESHQIAIYEEGSSAPAGALIFRSDAPELLVGRILQEHPDAGIALARSFHPFRQPFINSVIAKTARENVLFSITTALPDVIPNIIELPWAVAEFASDTAFLTMNQVRMAFLIAAASDREVGYLEQKSEIASVIGSAFGWRALSKQVVGKIPFGGGLIGKAAVAYAGTRVLGASLERLYSVGFAHSRGERERLYSDALHHGKKVAAKVLGQLRPDLAARLFNSSSEKPREASYTS